jgi:calcium/calmodulin-dependent protein kinase I
MKMIGKGNFAKVYSATNKATNKLVAIKAFEKDKFTDIAIDKVFNSKIYV